MQLSEIEAFKAMTIFLEEFFRETGGDFAMLLNDIEIEEDGITHDPGVWDEWMDAVTKVIGPRT